jgi:S1-C subfamily serine protease
MSENSKNFKNKKESSNSLIWPEFYGFEIYGNAGTYVTNVYPNSVAQKAGLLAGDHIIEVDNQDVSNKSSESLKQMVKNSKNMPPPISVRTALETVQLKPNKKLKKSPNAYGFNVYSENPIQIGQILENSPAYLAGLRTG